MDHDQSSCSLLQRALKRGQRRCHGRANSLRRFSFYQPQLGVRAWNKKVHFQALLIAKIVELLAHPTVGLTLDYFRCHKAFKQRSKEWRALKFSHRCQTEQVAGKAGVTQVDFRGLYQPLSEVFEIWRHENDLTCHLKNVQPVANRRHSDAERCSQVCLIQNLAVTARQKCQETTKRRQVAHVRDRSNVSFQIRLQVGSKPQATSLRPSEHLREASVQQIHLLGFRK